MCAMPIIIIITLLPIHFGSPLEVVLFSGNLEIPEKSCSISHFYPE